MKMSRERGPALIYLTDGRIPRVTLQLAELCH